MKSVKHHISKPDMKFIREDTCNKCNQKTRVYEMKVIGGPYQGQKIEVPYGCICTEMELAKEAHQAKQRVKRKKIQDMFDRYSLINSDLINKTLDDYQPQHKSQAHAKAQVMAYMDQFNIKNPQNLTLHGKFGVGKSHLAKVISDMAIAKGYSSIFISIPKLLRKIRATYNKDSEVNEDQLLEMLESVDVLVLDDIGTEKGTDWARERLFDLMDSRQGKHTIYTSNYSPKDLLKVIGERNYSRLAFNLFDQLEIIGKDQRQKRE